MAQRTAGVALLMWCVVAIASVAPASAQTPNPNSNYQGCQAFASEVTVSPGRTITISGSGANPGDTVTAALEHTIGSGTADGHGNFSFASTVPSTESAGNRTLTVTCGPNGGVAPLNLIIGPGGTGGGPVTTPGPAVGNGQATGGASTVANPGTGSLPRTGSGNAIPLTRLGIALIAVGALILALARRRRWARSPVLAD